jgi:hypothetical protein
MRVPPKLEISTIPKSPKQAIELHGLMGDIDRCSDINELKEITKGLLTQTVAYKNCIEGLLKDLTL